MQLKIWHKMIIGISIPSLIAILGGVLTYGYINDLKKRQNFVQIADDLKEHVLELRRNEKNFLRYKDAEHFEDLQNVIIVLNNAINNTPSEIKEEMGRELFFLLNKSIDTYSRLSNDLYENFQEEAKVTEEVRAEGRRLEEFVEKGKSAKEISKSFILNLRRLEKNYMLFRDKKSFEELNDGLSQLRNIIPFCFECIPYIEAIKKLFQTYDKSNLIADNLQVTGNKLEEIIGEIARGERENISSFLTLTQRLLLVALILLCTLGPIFVYKTATYIATPIKRLAEIAKKISEGDLSLRAPLKEKDETYSLALSFNTMLDHLQLTQESLEKSIELLREKQKETEKHASMGLLVSGVAHELNNPLNNISLTAETIMDDLKGLSHEELKEHIEDILKETERAQHIVGNLLDFAGARRTGAKRKLDIISVVKDSINLIANQLKVNNISLNQDINDGTLYVKGNRNKLEQVFINIMVNAIQAMEEGGTLSISVKPDMDNKHVLIKISDTGHGIPEEEIGKIFDPFFTTKHRGEGTGLGLSVSKSLIEEHRGEIEVESKVGVGSTFTVKLPLYNENV